MMEFMGGFLISATLVLVQPDDRKWWWRSALGIAGAIGVLLTVMSFTS